MEQLESKYNVLDRVYADTRLKRTSKAIMQYLIFKSDQRGCHPSVATIAEAINMSVRTVQRHMAYLEHYGYIQRISRYYRNEQLTNQYVFVMDIIDSETRKRDSLADDHMKEFLDKNHMNPSGNEASGDGYKKIYKLDAIIKTKLTPRESLVLIYLNHKANQLGVMYGRISVMAKQLQISVRLLVHTLRILCDKGYLILKGSKNVIVKLLKEVRASSYVECDQADAPVDVTAERYAAECYAADLHDTDLIKKCFSKIKGFWSGLWSQISYKLIHFLS